MMDIDDDDDVLLPFIIFLISSVLGKIASTIDPMTEIAPRYI